MQGLLIRGVQRLIQKTRRISSWPLPPLSLVIFFYSPGGGGGRSLEIPSLVFDNEDCIEEGTPKDAWRFIVSTPSCSTEKKIINEEEIKEQPYYYAILSLEEFWLQTSNSIVS